MGQEEEGDGGGIGDLVAEQEGQGEQWGTVGLGGWTRGTGA